MTETRLGRQTPTQAVVLPYEMANSGLRTIDYATGHKNRVDVAARRALMTGMSRITAKVNADNMEALDTEYVEVTWHGGARPSHQEWQGKVYRWRRGGNTGAAVPTAPKPQAQKVQYPAGKALTSGEESGIIHLIGDDSAPKYESYSFEPKVSKEVRSAFDDEYSRAVDKFGDITTIKGVQVLNDNSSDEGTYSNNSRFIELRHAEKKNGLKEMARIAREKFKAGKWSTSDPHHAMRHEIGHAIQFERSISDPNWSEKLQRLTAIYIKALNATDEYALPSEYSGKMLEDFLSECIAAGYVKKQSKTVREVCKIINEGVIL